MSEHFKAGLYQNENVNVVIVPVDRPYINNISNFVSNQQLLSNCNEIAFYNIGTSNVVINNAFTIYPGSSFAISGNANEVDTTNYDLSFTGAGSNNCVVIRKYYK